MRSASGQARCWWKDTPLYHASVYGNLMVVFLKHGPVSWRPWHVALKHHSFRETLHLLIGSVPDVNARGGNWAPLYLSSFEGHLEVVRVLLAKRCCVRVVWDSIFFSRVVNANTCQLRGCYSPPWHRRMMIRRPHGRAPIFMLRSDGKASNNYGTLATVCRREIIGTFMINLRVGVSVVASVSVLIDVTGEPFSR